MNVDRSGNSFGKGGTLAAESEREKQIRFGWNFQGMRVSLWKILLECDFCTHICIIVSDKKNTVVSDKRK